MASCPYKHVFGIPGQGVHSWRVAGLPVVDVLGTVALAVWSSRYAPGPVIVHFIVWLIIAEAAHFAAGTQTAFWAAIGIDPCSMTWKDAFMFSMSTAFSYLHLGLALFYLSVVLFVDDPRAIFAAALGMYVTLALLRAMGRCVLTDLEDVSEAKPSLTEVVGALLEGDLGLARGVLEELIVLFGLVIALVKILVLSLARSVYGIAYSCTWR